ncbi:WS/DGAT/MGAT family O-acyltransferase [Rhodococcus sp. 24CO]|uniref:WS/DGAT/MGAT family O-acyltransferase n=1 Tax=Rhodococcus sp. 24CO TaxID=3117460 RepID=UPI003D32744B
MQRLSGLDATFLYLETSTQLLHVCGLVILDPSTIPGGYRYRSLLGELDSRMAAMPTFRRKLKDSRLNLDYPVWVDDHDFDIERHCHRTSVPAPGGHDELAELAGHIASQPLDRSRPLWEMWVIEGLADGTIAVMSKIHHSAADGITGANILAQLCSLEPESPALVDTTAKTAGDAGTLDIAVGGLLAVISRPARLARLVPGGIAMLPKWVTRARKGTAMPAPFTAPRTSFNGAITGHRNIAFAQLDLAKVKAVKDRHGVKVNDVVLALCAGALRSYLEERGELPADSLVAMVPVSVHGKSDRAGTNQISGMFTQLGTQIADPLDRLRAISEYNATSKNHNEALGANMLQDWSQFASPAVFGAAMRVYSSLKLAERHPVVSNLVVSNVPGPPVPLYFLGARITGMFPLGPIFHGAGLNVTVMSLDGKVDVGIVSCTDLAPQLHELAQGFAVALDELLGAAETGDEESDGEGCATTTPSAT